jgi:large subunit ribosomal protein L29
MKPEALRDLTLEELLVKEKNMRKELFNLRFQSAVGHIENPNRFREVRREIARLLTIIQLKQSEAA